MLEGSQAGTALRASFIRLANPTKKSSKAMEELGVNLSDSKGKFVGMPKLIEQFKNGMEGMSREQKLANVAQIVGTEAASGFLTLIEAGPNKIDKFSKALKNSNGASKEAADKMKDNLKGSLEQLGGAFESLGINIKTAFGPALRKVVDAVTFVVEKISKLPKSVIVIGTIIAGLASAIPPLLILFGFMVTSMVSISRVIGPLLVGVSKAGGLMAFLSSKLATLVKLFPALGPAITFAGGPLLWIVGGLTALGIGFTIAYKKSETFRNMVNNALNGVKQTFNNTGNIIKGFFQLFKGNGQDGVITLSKLLPPDVVVGVTNFVDKLKEIFSNVKTVIEGAFQIFKGDGQNGVMTLSKILSPDAVVDVTNFIEGLKANFFAAMEAIKKFALEIGSVISTFWKQNGAEITEAVKKIGNVISTVFKVIWSYVIKPIMTLIWNIMKLLWPAIKDLIVSVWNNIKGVIKGALDIILGTVKIFSALFTGNWKGVWQGIKQVAHGALILLWNLVQLWFVGKILKVVKLFGGFLKTTMIGIWSAIKDIFSKSLGAIWNTTKTIFGKLFASIKGIFTNTKNFLSRIWTSIKNFIVKTVTSIWANVRNKFTGLYNSVKSIFTSVKNFAQKLWTSLKNNVVNLAKSLWSNVKNIFTKLWDSVKSIFTKIFNFSKSLWTSIKNTIHVLVNGAKNRVINGFKAMYDKGKSWINKLKGFLSDSISGFKKIASKVGKGIANGAISGLNKMIDGVNWLSKKIMDKKLIKNKIPKLSTGTGSNGDVKTNSKGQVQENTLAMVNDKGRGNGKGPNGHQELIRDKDGTMFAPQGRNVIVPLTKGMEVINGKQTQSMISSGMIPRFSAGSGTKKQTKEKKDPFTQGWDVAKATWNAGTDTLAKKSGEVVGKATSKAFEVWDYIENPGKLVQIALDKFGINFSKIKGVYGSFIKHGYAGLKKGLVKKVMSWFDDAGGYGSVDGSSILKHGISYGYSPNKPLAGYPLSINGGRHYGIDTPHQYEKIQAPTGGIVRKQYDPGGGTVAQILNGKLAQYYLHLTDVLKTGRIRKGQTFAKTGNSGANTTGPHLHTQIEEPAANALTNRNTKDPVKFLKGKGGKSGGSWLGTVRTALKIAKLPVTQKYINAWLKQIETESSGNARAMGGNDGLADGNAMGLVQVKPGTFKANQGKGMGNIWNPLHNLVAGMNYAKGRYRNSMLGVIGKGHGYATGGLINTPGWYNIAEQGHGEWIIPRDPSRRNDAMKLLALAANDIKSNNNKRPNQLPSPKNSNNGNSDTSLLMKMIEKQDETINALKASVELLTQIAAKDYEPVIDKYEHEKQIFKCIEKYERTKQRTGKYRPAY